MIGRRPGGIVRGFLGGHVLEMTGLVEFFAPVKKNFLTIKGVWMWSAPNLDNMSNKPFTVLRFYWRGGHAPEKTI